MSLVNERMGLKRMLDTVRGELAKNQAGLSTPGALMQAATQAQESLIGGSGGSGGVAEVQNVPMEGDMGPITNPNIASLG